MANNDDRCGKVVIGRYRLQATGLRALGYSKQRTKAFLPLTKILFRIIKSQRTSFLLTIFDSSVVFGHELFSTSMNTYDEYLLDCRLAFDLPMLAGTTTGTTTIQNITNDQFLEEVEGELNGQEKTSPIVYGCTLMMILSLFVIRVLGGFVKKLQSNQVLGDRRWCCGNVVWQQSSLRDTGSIRVTGMEVSGGPVNQEGVGLLRRDMVDLPRLLEVTIVLLGWGGARQAWLSGGRRQHRRERRWVFGLDDVVKKEEVFAGEGHVFDSRGVQGLVVKLSDVELVEGCSVTYAVFLALASAAVVINQYPTYYIKSNYTVDDHFSGAIYRVIVPLTSVFKISTVKELAKALALGTIVFVVYLFRRPKFRVPPGPRGIPLMGNVFQTGLRKALVYLCEVEDLWPPGICKHGGSANYCIELEQGRKRPTYSSGSKVFRPFVARDSTPLRLVAESSRFLSRGLTRDSSRQSHSESSVNFVPNILEFHWNFRD
ncbi:hypothetical protein K435DRAFT_792951 [Dendrothele bispora CBS 962.96]|uniref:Uncharacterized protein n=1 Tax=Dendrothele bispora (strain CBS 962.96) TaxID=1314807 RepID=A0A4S8MGQ1_DENBC|nr:hypothetical protein K435DRAFT_792951 [Dendrothele bispora CBS 962.96]